MSNIAKSLKQFCRHVHIKLQQCCDNTAKNPSWKPSIPWHGCCYDLSQKIPYNLIGRLVAPVASTPAIHAEIPTSLSTGITTLPSWRRTSVSHLNLTSFLKWSATLFGCITPLSSFVRSKLSHSRLLLLSLLAATHPWEKEALPVRSAALLSFLGHGHHYVCPAALLSAHPDTLFSVPYVLTKWCRRQHMTHWCYNYGFQHGHLPILYRTVCTV